MRAIIIAALALTGCAHTDPGVEIREVRVEVAVPVVCVDQKDVPAAVESMDAQYGEGWKTRLASPQIIDALAATILQLRATDRELRALLTGCVTTR